MARTGRPTKYNTELANLICERVGTHTVGLPKLCEMFDDLPSHETVKQWRYKYDDFSANYARAKMKQAELMAEELNKISSETHTYIDAEGNVRYDAGFTAAQRLKIDTIKWQASKLAPKIYGDKVHNNVTIVKHEDLLKELG